MTRGRVATVALLAYTATSFAYFGLRLLLTAHPSFVGANGDSEIFIWSFAWWPHALGHGQNPFVTREIWAPDGVNLAWATSVPGLALLFAPLTLLLGPVTSFNVAAVLLPALAAWTCFLLCRTVTRSTWGSLVGGYLFGFSSYMLGHEEGHMNLTSVFLIPLIALLIVRRVQGRLSRLRLAMLLGGLLALQLSFSTEVFFTVTFAGAIALAIAYATITARREALRGLAAPLMAAYLLAAALAAPLLYFALTAFQGSSINNPRDYTGDLLNVVVPTKLTMLSPHGLWSAAEQFAGGNDGERGLYLGLPTLLLILLFARQSRRSREGRFLVYCFVAAIVCELGAWLHVNGSQLPVPLPSALIDHLPLFDNVLPVRYSLFASLAAAVVVASWCAAPRRSFAATVGLPILAVAAVLPRPGSHVWIDEPSNPPFFADSIYRACLGANENILVRPYRDGGDAMLWQTESGFAFRMAGGYVGPTVPASFADFPAAHPVYDLESATPLADLLALAKAKGVVTVVADGSASKPFPALLPKSAPEVGGVVIYRVPGAPPLPAGCLRHAVAR